MLVSVIIPIFNAEKYLRQCLDSIIGQSFFSIEIILVDDGSTDGSPSICDEYAKEDSRVHVYHIVNSGANAARKYGVANASGEYVYFVDADDTIDSDAIEAAISLLSDNVDLVSMEEHENLNCSAETYGCRLLHWQAVHVWGKLFRRDLLLNDWVFDIPRDITIAEDLLMNLRIVRNISGWVVISSVHKYNYRIRKGSLAHSVTITPAYDWKILQHVTKIVDATPFDLRQPFVDFRISILRHLICGRYCFDRTWAIELKEDSKEWPLDAMQRRVIRAIDVPLYRPLVRGIVFMRKIKGKLARI